MIKSDLKLGTCLKHKQTGQLYKIAKRKRKCNKRSGWHLFTLHKIVGHEERDQTYSYLKYRLIRKYFSLDKTAQILYGK